MDKTKITLGAQIKAIREGKGLNQAEVAHGVGISQKALSQIETGKVIPRRTTLRALEGALGVDEGTLDIYAKPVSNLKRPSDLILKRLINDESGKLSALDLLPVLERFLNESPGVRAYVLAVLYGDASIRRLNVSAGKANSR